jgi:hypothetical protein
MYFLLSVFIAFVSSIAYTYVAVLERNRPSNPGDDFEIID